MRRRQQSQQLWQSSSSASSSQQQQGCDSTTTISAHSGHSSIIVDEDLLEDNYSTSHHYPDHHHTTDDDNYTNNANHRHSNNATNMAAFSPERQNQLSHHQSVPMGIATTDELEAEQHRPKTFLPRNYTGRRQIGIAGSCFLLFLVIIQAIHHARDSGSDSSGKYSIF
jgi:hypothetical protein